MPEGPLHVVLFGMPDAGKSSLLGALAQAAQTQEHVLAGRLVDSSKGLDELRHRVYENRPQQTQDEVVPYPVVYEPEQAGARTNAVLIDSDGRVANELLAHPRPLDNRRSPLARAVVDADALVLAVDASASTAQMEADFAQLTRFLRLLEQYRGRRTDVGGLPVYLVLTKCDLLAHTGDSPTAWLDAVEAKKQEVAQRFRDFLAREQTENRLPFGSIDLHVEATAVKRPARPQDPYGVAELFRNCFADARAFRTRQGWSNRRLLLTVAGSAALLVAMSALAGYLITSRPGNAPTNLQLDVNRFFAAEQDQSVAARHRNVKKKIEELTAFENNPEFDRLPPDRQEQVRDRLAEARAYQAFEHALNEIPDPAGVSSEEKLKDVEKALVQLHTGVRPSYWADWSETDAGRQYAGWLDDVDALEKAVRNTRQAYRAAIDAGSDVLRRRNEITGLPQKAREVLDRADELPTPQNDRDRLIPGSRRITFATVFGFKGVVQLRNQWDEVRKDLERYAPRGG